MTIQTLKRTKEEQQMLDEIEREHNVGNEHNSAYVHKPEGAELNKIIKSNVDTRDPDDQEVLLEKEVAKEKKDKEVATITDIFRKVTSPTDVNIKTLAVKDNTVEGYFSQITHNFYIGAKAVVYVCRDIALSKQTLSSNDYDKLKEFLEPFISRTTVTKYENIGQCDRLYEMLQKNLLPLQWTTQYQLSKLSDDDWKTVEPHLSATTTMETINGLLGVTKEERPPKFQYTIDNPVDVIRIAVSKGTEDAIKMTMLSQKIQKLVDEINLMDVKYYTRTDDIDFVSEMSVDTKFITETDEKAFTFMEQNTTSSNTTAYSDAKQLCPSPYLRKDANSFMEVNESEAA